jgi:hypothetical protein
VLLTKFSDDEIKKNELGRACVTCGGEKRRVQGFGVETLSETEHLETLVVVRRIILKWIFRLWDGA